MRNLSRSENQAVLIEKYTISTSIPRLRSMDSVNEKLRYWGTDKTTDFRRNLYRPIPFRRTKTNSMATG